MKSRGLVVGVALLGILMQTASAPAAPQPIKVAASIFPLADIVRQIGGKRVTVTTLLPAGASEHTFEPSASQIRQVADASLYVRVGAGLDGWADKLIASARQRPLTVTVTATNGIRLLAVAEQQLHPENGGDADHHDGDDPHVWLDPILVRDHLLPAVTDALSQLSPADASYFKTNSKNYALALTRLDQELRSSIDKLPRKGFIAMHGAWAYLAKRYGLTQVAAVEPFPGKEPSARYLVQLVSIARKQGVTTIFAEPQLPAKGAQVIAAEIGGRVLLLDPLGGEGVAGRDSYLGLMRHNLATITGGMR